VLTIETNLRKRVPGFHHQDPTLRLEKKKTIFNIKGIDADS
jgi:hypothetical protein